MGTLRTRKGIDFRSGARCPSGLSDVSPSLFFRGCSWVELFSCSEFSPSADASTLFSFEVLTSEPFSPSWPSLLGPLAWTAGLSESSDIIPKSSVSLKEVGLGWLRETCGCFDNSGGGGGGVGGSTGLGLKASEVSTQSPTEDETVAAQKEKASSKPF